MIRGLFTRQANIFALTAAVMLFTEIFSFLYLAEVSDRTRILLLTSLLDTAFLLSPYFILPPKWRRGIWILFLLLPVFTLTELLYFKHFGNFYYGNIILAGKITDNSVVSSALSLLKPTYILLFLPSLLLIAPYILLRKGILTQRYSVRTRCLWFCLILCIPPCAYFLTARRYYRSAPPEKIASEHTADCNYHIFNDPSYKPQLAMNYGVSGLFIRTLCDIFPQRISIDEKQRSEIISVLSSSSRTETADSLFSGNSNKNLILLIVESLNSSVFRLPEAQEICPNLCRLIQDSSSVYVPEILSQTGPGNSSDGQLMYNTGLYPVSYMPFVTEYGMSDYPSIAKALKNHSNSEIIYEDQQLWNHWSTTRSYGFRHLYSDLYDESNKGKDEDYHVISKVIEVADTISRPFFLQVTTYSTHEPYDRLRISPVLKLSDASKSKFDTKALNYLQTVGYFDRQLGRLLAALDSLGLKESTIMAIVGDHSAPSVAMSPMLDCNTVPLIITNTGVTQKYDRTIGQIDLFPTLLDLMSIEEYILPQTGKNYRGLGRSIFSTDSTDTATVPTDSLRRLSQLMILSRFFD